MDRVEVMTPGGVGYAIDIPVSTFERLPREGEEVELFTHQVTREDSISLYGFVNAGERAVFARLLTASGVGPRLAVNILSTLSPDRLIDAIRERDVATLRQAPGLGVKKAERLVLELGDKIDDLAAGAAADSPAGRHVDEAVGALVALGYPAAQAATLVRRALDDDPELRGPDLIKAALAQAG